MTEFYQAYSHMIIIDIFNNYFVMLCLEANPGTNNNNIFLQHNIQINTCFRHFKDKILQYTILQYILNMKAASQLVRHGTFETVGSE